MAFKNPLIDNENQWLSGLMQKAPETQVPSEMGSRFPANEAGVPTVPGNYTPDIRVTDWSPAFTEFGTPQTEQQVGDITDWEPIVTEQQAQEAWGEFNRPEDVVPLSSQKSIPKYLGERAVAAGKTAYGATEAVVASLIGGAISGPASGYAGLKDVLVAYINDQPADKAAETIQRVQEELNKYMSPSTERGKEIYEKVGMGAEAIFGPIAQFGKENIVEPSAKWAGKRMGPEAAGIVGAVLTAIPELSEYYASEGVGTGPIRSTLRRVSPALDLKTVTARIGPTIRKSTALRRAKIILNETMGALNEKSLKAARFLENKIPGLKLPTAGYFADDAITKRAFLALQKNDVKASEMLFKQAMENKKALTEYLKGIKEPTGEASLKLKMEYERVKRELQMARAQSPIIGKLDQMESGVGPESAGKRTRKIFKEAEKDARNEASRLFNAVPDDMINAKGFLKELKDILKPESSAEVVERNIPKEIFKGIKYLEENNGFTTVNELYKIRKTWRRALDNMHTSTKKNRFAERRLSKAMAALDEQMKKTLMDPGVSADALERARKFYYEEVVKKYETPTMQDLKKLSTERGHISDAEVVGQFFKKGRAGIDSARQFMEASNGRPGAMRALQDFIDDDFARYVRDETTGALSKSKLNNWLKNHREALREFGLEDRYSSYRSAQNAVDAAQKNIREFEKLRVSKMTDLDVGFEMDQILGSKTPRQDAIDFVRLLGGDEDAMRAARNAYIDRFVEFIKSEDISIKDMNAFYRKHKGAMDVLFEGHKDKLRALNNYRNAIRRAFPKGEIPDDLKALGPVFDQFYKNPWVSRNVLDTIITSVIRYIPDIGKEKVREIVRRAAVDPEFADVLRKTGKDIRRNPKLATDNLRLFLKQVVVPSTTQRLMQIKTPQEEPNTENMDRILNRLQ